MALNRISRVMALTIVLVMVMALLPALPRAAAQGGGAIAYGDVVTGSVTAKSYYEVWSFDGQKGDQVEILMEGDGNLDPYLGLIDFATEEVLIEDDDSAGNSNALIEFTLPATGSYVIVATRYNFDIGTSTGQYTLALSGGNGPTPVSNPDVTDEPTTAFEPVEIEPGIWYMGDLTGDPVMGAITDDSYAQLYSIELAAGEEFIAIMMANTSSLDSYLFIADEEFNILAEDDDSGADLELGPLDAVISLTAKDAGLYYVVATRANLETGATSGSYMLITGVPEGEPEPQAEEVDDGLPPGVDFMAEMSIDQVAEGAITADSFMHLYSFEGQAGDEITISMSSDAGLDSYLGLLDPEGEVIAEDDDSGGEFNALMTYTLPESGSYLIAATRSGIDEGTSVGAYMLEISAGAPAAVNEDAGLSGFGGLPGRAIESAEGTFYLRGNGPSGDPEKSPPIEAFMGLDTQLPGARNPFNPLHHKPGRPWIDVLSWIIIES